MSFTFLPFKKTASDTPCDGSLQKCPSFCTAKHSERCVSFYKKLTQPGFHRCPFGYTVYSFVMGKELAFFSGLYIEGYSDAKKLHAGNRVPELKLPASVAIKAETILKDIQRKQDAEEQHQSFIHDVRNLNKTIKGHLEYLIDLLAEEQQFEYVRRGFSALSASNLLTQRMNYLRYYSGDETFVPKEMGIHGKFYKAHQLFLTLAKTKNLIFDKINGNSVGKMMAFSFIDCMPAVLIENAVKYSPEGEQVKIEIQEDVDCCRVKITNWGPALSSEEAERIFDKGFRGKSAKNQAEGSGIGLSFVKEICDLHSIKIGFYQQGQKVIQGKDYSHCTFELKIPRCDC